MADLDAARAAQLRNIETKTGQSLAALGAAIATTGKVKHGEIRSWLIAEFGLGYGDANGLATHYLAGSAPAPAAADALDEIYAGKKAHLRAIHDALLAAISPWGDFEVAPKKTYVALRRKKQFAMLGHKTATHAELGINLKGEVADARVVAQPPGGMCQYAVRLATPTDLDDALLAVVRRAFEAAG